MALILKGLGLGSTYELSLSAMVFRLLESVSDDDTVPNADIDSLSSVIYVNLLVLFAIGAIFEISRPHLPRLYSPRRTRLHVAANRIPPQPSKIPFGWLWQVSQVPEDDLLRMAGLDAYMFIRFLKLCIKFSFMVTFLGVVILVPVYASGTMADELNVWGRYTLAKVKSEDTAQRLWAPVVLMYLYAAIFCHWFKEEYKHFLTRRAEYFMQGGSPDTPDQTYYTVMVENVPAELRSSEALSLFFEELFPGKIYNVGLTFDISELRGAAARRRQLVAELEHQIAVWKGSGTRPMVKVRPWSRFTAKDLPVGVATRAGNPDSQYPMLMYWEYDLIDYLAHSLTLANNEVSRLQQMLFQHRVEGAMTPFSSANFVDRDRNTDSLDTGDLEKDLLQHDRSLPMKAALSEGSRKSDRKLNDAGREDSDEQGSDSPLDPSNHDTLGKKGHADTDAASPRTPQVLNEISSTLKGTAVRLANEGANTGIDAVGSVVAGLKHGIRDLRAVTGTYYTSSQTAFVTFNSSVSTSMAYQMFLSVEHYHMKTLMAPDPDGIIWDNVDKVARNVRKRRLLADFGIYFAGLFWGAVVAFITAISNLDELSKRYTWLEAYKDTKFFSLLNAYLASLLLLVILALLPLIFWLVARYYEGIKVENEIQKSIMTRYFYYQLINVVVSVGLGSLLSNLQAFLKQPEQILTILGSSVPTFSVYFTNFIVVKAFTGLPLEMLRTWPFIQTIFLKCFLNERECSWRALHSGVFQTPQMVYGWIYPSLLMVLIVVCIYATIAPLVVPAALVYFIMAFYMYKYQLLHVYVNKFQGGGDMWIECYRYSMMCLMAGSLMLMCYLGIKTFFGWQFRIMVVLPFVISYFWRNVEKAYLKPSLRMSLRKSVLIDQDKKTQAASIATFDYRTFLQPDLVEPIQRPLPYRPGAPSPLESESGIGIDMSPSARGVADPSNVNTLNVDEDDLDGVYEEEPFLSDGTAWGPGGLLGAEEAHAMA